MMSDPVTIEVPEGYRICRPLNIRSGSSVYLAETESGRACALKIQKLNSTESVAELKRHRLVLVSLSLIPGFTPISNWGLSPAYPPTILWEEMPVADDLTATNTKGTSNGNLYVPCSMAAWLAENTFASTEQVIKWGIRLAKALEQLHREGLLHRDVKPANILFFSGEPCLADYGSIGIEGSPVLFPGTEGYVPPDGVGSRATDVFALGRTLYELWTGLDRFRFPSLPARVKVDDNWERHGWLLNKTLLRAADSRPSHRYASASKLIEGLEIALGGAKRASRRKFFASVAAGGAATIGFYIWKGLPSHRAIWRRLPPKRFGYENWLGNALTCDWDGRKIYSINSDSRGTYWQRYDFPTWTHAEIHFPDGPRRGVYSMLHPESKDLWAVEMVSGQMIRIDLEGRDLIRLEHALVNELDFTGPIYWNPITRRIGKFAGYGNFNNSISRRELDLTAKNWVLIPEGPGVQPWPRYDPILMADRAGKRLFMFGGQGNPSGRQSEEVANLRDYDGRYYPLNDLWELDLSGNQWTPKVGVQKWNPGQLKAGIFHPGLNAILFLTGSDKQRPANSAFHMFQLDQSSTPAKLPSSGETIRMFQFWSLLIEPQSGDLWVFADEGVFAVSLMPA